MLESSVSLSQTFYFDIIIELWVKGIGRSKVSVGSKRIWTATQIISVWEHSDWVLCSQTQDVCSHYRIRLFC